MKYMRINIRAKILAVFSLVIIICIAAIGVNFALLTSLIQKTDHIFNVIDPTANAAHDLRQSFNIDIRAIEEYGNGYTSDVDEAEGIVGPSEEKIKADIAKIEKSGLIPESHITLLRDILARDEVEDERIFDLRKKDKENPKQHIISPEVYTAIGAFDSVSDEVSKEIEKIISIIEMHKIDYVKVFVDDVVKSKTYIIAAFSVAIALSVIIVYIASLVLSVSIRKVRAAAFKISQGDLDQRAPVTSKDEIGDLAGTFNQMADNIEKSQEDMKKANVTLEEQGEKLKDQLEQVRKFQKITIDREMKMIELKEKLKECERDHGKKYE